LPGFFAFDSSALMRSSFALIFLITVAAAFAYGQMTVIGPQSVFDGQKVDAVDLIGNPHRDLEPLRAVVSQKAGSPYSEAEVEDSIQALQEAGNFPTVSVEVVPDTAGLRLNFLLEPAYYLGIIDFPGAVKKFAYMRLLGVANLADEDPYDPARLPVAQESLQNFLRSNGYFGASIRVASTIDDEHQLVNLSFTVELGKQARVGTVDFAGVDSAEGGRLQKSVRSLRARLMGGLLKPGKPYTAERMKSATALIRRTLAQQHRLASKVNLDPPRFHPESDRVDVSFKVELGPVVTVRMQGAKLSKIPYLSEKEMKKLIPIYSEGTIDRDLVEEGEQNLTDFFQKKGYSDVKVTTDLTQQSDRILLVYDIERGKKSKVERIELDGNNQISEDDLLSQVVIKKSHIWTHGSVSPKLLKQSVSNMEAFYRDKGYESAKITSRVVDHESRVDVTFEIEEGPQTLVDNVEITGNTSISQDQLTAPNGFDVKAGGPFSARRLSQDRNRISATYLNRGYLNAEVKATIDRHDQGRRGEDPHRVSVIYAITEHQLVRVSDVLYLGQKKTRLALIKKTANITPDAPMRKGELLAGESHLYDLNVFDWSSVGPRKPITDQDEEMALVKVHEAKQNEITYGFGFEIARRGGNIPAGTVAVPGGPPIGLGGNRIAPSEATFASPLGSIDFNRRNLRGLGETASASILLARLDQRVVTTYSQPHFLDTQWSSLSNFSIERTSENPLFTAGLGDLSFQLERLISRKNHMRLQLRYDFNKTQLSHLLVPELVLPQDRSVHLSTFSGTLIRDTRDKPLDAHRGSFATLNLGITPVALGSSANFAKLFGQYAYYRPVHSLVFANSVRVGFAESFAGSFVPTSQLFFSGGGTSLRGFPIDQAGPQRIVPFCNVLLNNTGCVDIPVPLGGRQLFIVNSEIRFPLKIMKELGGVGFYDGGNVFRTINAGDFGGNFSHTVGLGLRYSTPIGPIRIDIGRNLNPQPGLSATQYFITLGQAF
jgi:outer membrane protein insertion porin family